MSSKIVVNISDIAPSQLYINEEKLAKVRNELDRGERRVIPIKKIGDKIFYTDGHTRALAYYLSGEKEIECEWDEDDLSWDAYFICVNWCLSEGIKSIADLSSRIISDSEYKSLWDRRCNDLHKKLKSGVEPFINITQLDDPEKRSTITKSVLTSLPQWFGIDEAIVDYVEGVKTRDLYLASIGNLPVGFFSIEHHYRESSEIYLCGIYPEFHRLGIGRLLLNRVEEDLREDLDKRFLSVKTLSERHPDRYYKLSRNFYMKMGFYPLEEFRELWGEENPALLMVKSLR